MAPEARREESQVTSSGNPAAPATPSTRAGTAAESAGARGASAAIYGTIVVSAVIAALSEDPAAGPGEIASAALLTVVVFWLAHVYADLVGERAATDDRTRWHSPLALLAQEGPMVEAALVPMIPLLLGMLGALHRTAAIRGGLAVGVAELSLWGYLAGRHLGPGLPRLAGALFIALLGVGVALLKLLVH
jgi:hypothetical protein